MPESPILELDATKSCVESMLKTTTPGFRSTSLRTYRKKLFGPISKDNCLIFVSINDTFTFVVFVDGLNNPRVSLSLATNTIDLEVNDVTVLALSVSLFVKLPT